MRASTVYCLRPGLPDAGWEAVHLATRLRLVEAFGPRVNIVSLPKGPMYLGRAGLTQRTVYEMNMIGHGVLLWGGGAPLEIELDAIEKLEIPLGLVGFTEAELLHLEPAVLAALAARSVVAVGVDGGALGALYRAGAKEPVLGGPPGVFAERVQIIEPGLAADTIIVPRNPALMGLPDTARAGLVTAQIRGLARLIKDEGRDIRLLCQSPEALGFGATFTELNYIYLDDPRAWLGELRHAKQVISYQITASLYCAGAGIPFLHISADPSDTEQLSALGLQQWVVDATGDGVVEICGRLLNLLDDQKAHRLVGLGQWGTLDRATGEAMTAFARAVTGYREDEVKVRRANAFLPEEPTQPLLSQATQIDLPAIKAEK